MRAPHRMDVMVSAMTKDGLWHCNQKCIHCYAAGQEHGKEEELSTDDWKKIINKCREIGIPQLTFTGGEPTVREDLFELIDSARWFVTRLNTNGINLTPDYCKGLRKTDLDNVQITFYSYEKSIHESLTCVSCFEKTVDGIKNAINAGLSVSINTPLCSLNSDYVKTLQFLHELGVIYVTCSGMIPSGNAIRQDQQDDQLTKEELTSILQKAVDYCRDNDMEIQFTSPGQVLEDDLRKIGLNVPSCGACLSNMAVTPGGKVVSCQSALSSPVLGDMLEDPWDKIWNSRRCRAIRNESAKMMQKCPLQEVNSIEL
jgi:MoaA/NifB/PqqE/SkfB family radical SAM enzyme